MICPMSAARGVMVSVQPCGLHVDSSSPWLAASPDGIVLDPSQSANNQKAHKMFIDEMPNFV